MEKNSQQPIGFSKMVPRIQYEYNTLSLRNGVWKINFVHTEGWNFTLILYHISIKSSYIDDVNTRPATYKV